MSSKWGPSPFEDESDDESSQTSYRPHYEPIDSKRASRSKTVWSGIAVSSLSVLSYLQGLDIIQNYPAVIAGIGVTIGIGMIVLRYLTNQPVQAPSVIIRPKQMPNSQNKPNANSGGLWGR